MYTYRTRFQVQEVHDGDTLWVDIDLGFNISRKIKLRLKDVWCPELSTGFEGSKATDALRNVLGSFQEGVVVTEKDKMSFDRYVGTLYVGTVPALYYEYSVNAKMNKLGYVKHN